MAITTKATKEPVKLSPDEMAALDQGIRSADEGRTYSLEEAFDFARKQRQIWKKSKIPVRG